jgi:hypothetical protein
MDASNVDESRSAAVGSDGAEPVLKSRIVFDMPRSPRARGPAQPQAARRAPASVARMLALAHQIERACQAGRLKNHAAAARELSVTRARVAQLVNLTFLAPDIQDVILALEAIDGVEPLSERALRPIATELSWVRQRELWAPIREQLALPE